MYMSFAMAQPLESKVDVFTMNAVMGLMYKRSDVCSTKRHTTDYTMISMKDQE